MSTQLHNALVTAPLGATHSSGHSLPGAKKDGRDKPGNSLSHKRHGVLVMGFLQRTGSRRRDVNVRKEKLSVYTAHKIGPI